MSNKKTVEIVADMVLVAEDEDIVNLILDELSDELLRIVESYGARCVGEFNYVEVDDEI